MNFAFAYLRELDVIVLRVTKRTYRPMKWSQITKTAKEYNQDKNINNIEGIIKIIFYFFLYNPTTGDPGVTRTLFLSNLWKVNLKIWNYNSDWTI